jgi:UDP-N-acetylmuramyl pentapeptide synthase
MTLWTTDAMADAMRADRRGKLPSGITGISIDTRTIEPSDAFFAIQGDNRDGHDFVEAALQADAGLPSSRATSADDLQTMRRCSRSTTCSTRCVRSRVRPARGSPAR